MRKPVNVIATLLVAVLASHMQQPALALDANPTVSWSSPSSGSTVSGEFTLVGVARPDATGTSTIAKWCFSMDGKPLTSRFGIGFSRTESDTSPEFYPGDSYGGGLQLDADGCGTTWRNARKVFLPFDSTQWTNGNHTWTAKVTDSAGRESTVASISLTSSNASPTVSWSSPSSGSTVSGEFTLVGVARPDATGTSTIAKWCFSMDGKPLTSRFGIGFSRTESDTSPEFYPGDSYGGGLQLDADGCGTTWRNARKVFLPFDSTQWTNGNHTWTAKVTDSAGRESTVANFVVSFANALPVIGAITVTQNPDSRSILANWSSSSDTKVTVTSCFWEIEGVRLTTKSCAENKSAPVLPSISPGNHNIIFGLVTSTGDTLTKQSTFSAKAFILTAAKTKLVLTCPRSYNGTVTCSVTATNSLGIKGTVNVKPMFSVGGGSWRSTKTIKVSIGKKTSIKFLGSNDSLSIKATATVSGTTISSATSKYLPSVSTVLTRLQAAGSLSWKTDKVPYRGGGYGPDSIYLSSDSTGYCGVWVYRSSSDWMKDYTLGVFPWNYNPYWSFTDKRSGFGIFATVSSRPSNCSKEIKKTFGLR